MIHMYSSTFPLRIISGRKKRKTKQELRWILWKVYSGTKGKTAVVTK